MRLTVSTNTLFLLRQLDDCVTRKYVPFRTRLMAFLIDHVLFCAFSGMLLSLLLRKEILHISHSADLGISEVWQAIYLYAAAHPLVVLLLFTAHWLYFASFESSGFQATPGKLAMQFSLVSCQHKPITFWQATLRHFCKVALLIPCGLTYWVGLFSTKKQLLHDRICGCLHMSR